MNTKKEVDRIKDNMPLNQYDNSVEKLIDIIENEKTYNTPVGEVRFYCENLELSTRIEKFIERQIELLNFGIKDKFY